MKLFEFARKSFYSPSFYRAIPLQPWRQVLRYWFRCVIFAAVLGAIFSGYFAAPMIAGILRGSAKAILAPGALPENFTLEIKEDRAVLSGAEQFRIPMDSGMKDALPDKLRALDSLVWVNPDDFSESKFKESNSLIWIARDVVAVRDTTGGVFTEPANALAGRRIDRTEARLFGEQIEALLPWSGAIAIFFFALIIFGSLAGTLVWLIPASLIVWLMALRVKTKFRWPAAYKIAIYAATPAYIIWGAIAILGPTAPAVLALWLAVAILSLINIRPNGRAAADKARA